MNWPSRAMAGTDGRSLDTDISTTSDGDVRKARAWMVWGAMGTQTMPVYSGLTMGPPADRAYPVDPVAVETTTPSPRRRSM